MQTRSGLFYALCICVSYLICSCSGLPNYGALGPAGGNGEVSIADLKTGWEGYDHPHDTALYKHDR